MHLELMALDDFFLIKRKMHPLLQKNPLPLRLLSGHDLYSPLGIWVGTEAEPKATWSGPVQSF